MQNHTNQNGVFEQRLHETRKFVMQITTKFVKFEFDWRISNNLNVTMSSRCQFWAISSKKKLRKKFPDADELMIKKSPQNSTWIHLNLFARWMRLSAEYIHHFKWISVLNLKAFQGTNAMSRGVETHAGNWCSRTLTSRANLHRILAVAKKQKLTSTDWLTRSFGERKDDSWTASR